MLQTAIVAKRDGDSEPDTTEIRQLTEAAGARVVAEVSYEGTTATIAFEAKPQVVEQARAKVGALAEEKSPA